MSSNASARAPRLFAGAHRVLIGSLGAAALLFVLLWQVGAQAQAVQRLAGLSGSTPGAQMQMNLVWTGADITGDGMADFANPTGRAMRLHDHFGSGTFGASRDGGRRLHAGVDYQAMPGQAVGAPIAGRVTRIGFAYGDDAGFKYVEITNVALSYTARVFYVEPGIRVGDTVAIGDEVGRAVSLQGRYPGITDHVHLEIDRIGRHAGRVDATRVILARMEPTLNAPIQLARAEMPPF